MLIGWIQEHSLVDYPGCIACVVFTVGCNFRCPFCHNPELVLPKRIESLVGDLIPEDSFFTFLDQRRWLLDGVSICWWEPTLQCDLYDFVLQIKQHWFLVKLDTNGSNADIVEKLIVDGLVDYVAVDLKHHRFGWEKAAGVSLSSFFHNFERLLSILQRSTISYEYRTTVVQWIHGEKDITLMAQSIAGVENYYLQTYVTSKGVLDSSASMSPYDFVTMQKFCDIASNYVSHCYVRT